MPFNTEEDDPEPSTSHNAEQNAVRQSRKRNRDKAATYNMEDLIDGTSVFDEDGVISSTQNQAHVTVRETRGPGKPAKQRSLERSNPKKNNRVKRNELG